MHVLGDLFIAAMQVAHHRISLGDDLTVQLQHQAQHAVRGGMGRAHVQRQPFTDQVSHGLFPAFQVQRGLGGWVERFDLAGDSGHGSLKGTGFKASIRPGSLAATRFCEKFHKRRRLSAKSVR